MKITRKQLRRIIREQTDSFSDRLTISTAIRDAIIDHLENEKFFGDEMGGIPQSVITVIENSSVRIVDAMEGKRVNTNGNGSLDPDELRAIADDLED
jgi:hypothetical protein